MAYGERNSATLGLLHSLQQRIQQEQPSCLHETQTQMDFPMRK
jgi:hypothetical protein